MFHVKHLGRAALCGVCAQLHFLQDAARVIERLRYRHLPVFSVMFHVKHPSRLSTEYVTDWQCFTWNNPWAKDYCSTWVGGAKDIRPGA